MIIKDMLNEDMYAYCIYGNELLYTKKELINNIIYKLVWITYRKGYQSLVTQFEVTSDKGWGCSIRAGQMLVANLLLLFRLHGKEIKLHKEENIDGHRIEIIKDFVDKPENVLSIHNIVKIMNEHKFCVGQYNTFVSPLTAMKDILKQKYYRFPMIVKTDYTINKDEAKRFGFSESDYIWNPFSMVLCMALGSGVQGKNNRESLEKFINLRTFAGMVIGIGHGAMYVYGILKNKLLYLDPHNSRKVTYSVEEFSTSSKCRSYNSVDISQIGDQVCIAFMFKTEKDVDKWFETVKCIKQDLIMINDNFKSSKPDIVKNFNIDVTGFHSM